MNNELDEEVILNTQEETTTTPQEEVEKSIEEELNIKKSKKVNIV